MSKGKELPYSSNRSFEKIWLPLFRDVTATEKKTDILLSVAQITAAGYKAKNCWKDNTLFDVPHRELINVNFSVTLYRNIELKLG
jgi:hypothetical protein